MTLARYFRVLRQQWFVVILVLGLTIGAVAAYTFEKTPIYAAKTQLFVSVSNTGSDISQLQQGGNFTSQRVKSYTDIVTSPIVLDKVIADLNLPLTLDELTKKITVDSPLDTVLLNIRVEDADPNLAAAIARAIADDFPTFVTRLETPRSASTSSAPKSPVTISVTIPAAVPIHPVSPRVPLNLAVGLFLGLALAFAAAVLRDQLDTAVGGVADIEALTHAIPLGVVPFDSGASKHPLVDIDQQSARSEAFRTLRTNLQFADVDKPPQVIVVTSALPSEGKSTSACNIALTLAVGGANVVLVDGDMRKPAVGKYFGISNAAGLSSVLAGQHELRDVMVNYGREQLAILPSGRTPPNPSELLGSKQMLDLMEALAGQFDMVIIDAPPLLPVTDAAVLAAAADGAVLVVRYGKSRREEVQRAMQTLHAVNAKLLGTVLNFAPKRKGRGAYDGYGYGYGYGPATPALPAPNDAVRRPAGPPAGVPLPPLVPGANGHAGDRKLLNGDPPPLLNGGPSFDPDVDKRGGRRSRA